MPSGNSCAEGQERSWEVELDAARSRSGARDAGTELTPQPVAELNRFLGPAIIGLAMLSYIRRKAAIGGWLFFFFGEAYIGVVFGVVASVPVVAAAFPAEPSIPTPNARLIAMVVLLRLFGYLIIAVASTLLLKQRNSIWVERLRFAIGAALLVNGIAVVVDKFYFPGTFVGNLGRWLVLLAWLVYFFVSVRVRMVFFSKTWGEMPAAKILE